MADDSGAALPSDFGVPTLDKAMGMLGTQIKQTDAAATDVRKRDASIEKSLEDLASRKLDREPPKLEAKSFDQQPPEAQPFKAFGSFASNLAILGSALTRQPLTSALNASASAMNALRKNDLDTYQSAFESWKANTEFAFKRAEFEQTQYHDAVELFDKDLNRGLSVIRAQAALNQDETMLAQIQTGNIDGIVKLVTGRQNLMLEGAKARLDLEIQGTKWGATLKALNDWSEQHGGQKPDGLTASKIIRETQSAWPTGVGGVTQEKWDAQKAAMSDYDKAQEDLKKAQKDGDKSAENDAQQRMHEADRKIEQITGKSQGSGAVDWSPEKRSSIGSQVATGEPLNQIFPGYGGKNSAGMRDAARDAGIEAIKAETGMNDKDAGVELAYRQIEFTAGKSSIQQLDKMRGATDQALQQLDFNIGKAKEEISKLGTSDFSPLWNDIILKQDQIMAHPEFNRAAYFINAAMMESARILSGGQASVAQMAEGARKDAEKYLGMNIGPDQASNLFEGMHQEGENRIENYTTAMQHQRPSGMQREGAKRPPAPTLTDAQKKQFTDPEWSDQYKGYVVKDKATGKLHRIEE